MAGLVFLLVFWALAGACQRHGVGDFFIVQFFFFFFFWLLASETKVEMLGFTGLPAIPAPGPYT